MYVHVPFCARRCSYCDFSIAVRRSVPVADFIDGVGRELQLRFGAPDHPWILDTLYLGGGTPSHLGPEGVAQLVGMIRAHATPAPGAEVTIEANPEDVTPHAASAWLAAGVTRVSLGAQTFDDDVLRWMHRVHDAAAIPHAVRTLREAGFAEISVDLIFALPAELNRDWSRDVGEVLALEPEHVSLYGLTIEPKTPLGRWNARGEVQEAPEERYEADFLEAHERLGAAGFEHYEVSNYARAGFRARHNSSYWSGAPYAGIGPAAHAFDGSARRWNVPPYARWLELLRAGHDPVGGREMLTPANLDAEHVYLGLRTTGGLELEGWQREMVQPWVDAGWGTLKGNRLVLTPLGWLRLDSLAAELMSLRTSTA